MNSFLLKRLFPPTLQAAAPRRHKAATAHSEGFVQLNLAALPHPWHDSLGLGEPRSCSREMATERGEKSNVTARVTEPGGVVFTSPVAEGKMTTK